MSNAKDAGRFVFNQDEPLMFARDRRLVPAKPHNMPTSTEETERFSPNNLYTYSMGISEIQAQNNTYDEANVFVTKPLRLHENVLEVSLEALEEHPVFDEVSGRASEKQTSVEYYLALQDNPAPSDWLPILPKQTKRVRGERLFFQGLNAETLFPFEMSNIQVYKDGVRLKESDYHILNNQNIQLESVKSDHAYTIDYTPNPFVKNPYVLEVNDYKHATTRIVEEFPEGTDINKTVTLKHVPYIDRERLLEEENYNPNTSSYRPVEVSIEQGAIRGSNGSTYPYVPPRKLREGEPYMVNKSLYLDNSWSDMQRYNLETGYLGIDYYQYKNKITLAEHINVPMIEENERETPGTGTIRVAYDALVTDFRLKIILRRNTRHEITATPRVKEYKLNFKAIR